MNIEEARTEVIKLIKTAEIEKESAIGIFLMLKTVEKLNKMAEFLRENRNADQTAILKFAALLYNPDLKFTL